MHRRERRQPRGSAILPRPRPVDGGTRVDFIAEDVPEGISAEDHAAGLESSLANLAAYVEE
jgi:hypothetical protein